MIEDDTGNDSESESESVADSDYEEADEKRYVGASEEDSVILRAKPAKKDEIGK